MKPDSHNKTIFRSIWGWKGKSGRLPQTAPSVPPLSSTKLIQLAQANIEAVLEMLNTSSEGLSELQSNLRLSKIGLNEIAHEKPPKWYVQLLKTFQNPLAILLIILAVIALLTEDVRAAVIIFSMVIFSVILRFSQEFRGSSLLFMLNQQTRCQDNILLTQKF
jgi:Mg2+-importing ATPase